MTLALFTFFGKVYPRRIILGVDLMFMRLITGVMSTSLTHPGRHKGFFKLIPMELKDM